MSVYKGNLFNGGRYILDGHQWIANKFINCILVYGGGPLSMTGNQLLGVKWEFNDAAARTIALLSSFVQQGGESTQFVNELLSTFLGPPPTQAGAAGGGGSVAAVSKE